MKVGFEQETLPGGCGTGCLYEFYSLGDSDWEDEDLEVDSGGAGTFVASFIPNEVCEAVYRKLCKKYRLVFQTAARINQNSQNLFFTAVFDRHDDAEALEPMPGKRTRWFTEEQVKSYNTIRRQRGY